jgi:uncharacterized membrane protein YfcA
VIDFLVALGVALLSGLGVGSGGLLVVWLTIVRGLGQIAAQGINLFFFIFSSGASTVVNFFTRKIAWKEVSLLSAGGSIGAAAGWLLLWVIEPNLLKKLFGAMLLAAGLPSLLRAFKKKE